MLWTVGKGILFSQKKKITSAIGELLYNTLNDQTRISQCMTEL